MTSRGANSNDDRGRDASMHAECYACPVGTFFERMEQAASPDTMDRLLGVAHELLDIARSAIDAADLTVEEQRAARTARNRRTDRVRHIDIA
jgi:hypothetical protein